MSSFFSNTSFLKEVSLALVNKANDLLVRLATLTNSVLLKFFKPNSISEFILVRFYTTLFCITFLVIYNLCDWFLFCVSRF